MAALLVSVAVMSVLMSMAMPVWRHQAIREKEAELVFRGEQYARAIALYQRKLGPGSLPPGIDVLVEQKFLRKKYKDPMSEDGEFQILYAAQQAGGRAGGQAQAGGGRGGLGAGAARGAPGVGVGQGQAGPRGGMIGVASKSSAASIRVYNDATRYNEWQFLFTQFAAQPGARGGQPGAGPGQPGRGGQRGGQRGLGEGRGRGGQRGRGGFGPGRGPGGRGPGGTVGPGIVRPPGGRGPGGG